MQQDGWFSDALGIPCHLVSCSYDRNCKVNEHSQSKLSFVNEEQFLCISKRSFELLREQIWSDKQQKIDLLRFRGNLVIDDNLLIPFEEETWVNRTLQIGDQYFHVKAVI